MNQFFLISGIVIWALLAFYFLMRLLLGKNWWLKIGIHAFVGSNVIKSGTDFIKEVRESNLQDETAAKLGIHILWRLTRIGIITILIALIPIILLFQQNLLIQKQNLKIDNQNNLIEADRRSSLVLLMSNIMDQINAEINLQRPKGMLFDTIKYQLSDPLIGRIAALSQSLLPYRYLKNDTLSQNEASFERGQLLLSLINSNLDKITLDKIYSITNFSYSYLSSANLSNAYLAGIDLHGATLDEADLFNSNLNNATLSFSTLDNADFSNSTLTNADLTNASLIYAFLTNADLSNAFISNSYSDNKLGQNILRRVEIHGPVFQDANLLMTHLEGAILPKDISYNQLKSAKTLYDSKGISKEFKEQLLQEKPCLFERPFSRNACF